MGILDALWLTVIARSFYESQIGPLLLAEPNMIAALLFYVVYLIGVVVFVIQPALAHASIKSAITKGALFGFVAYATYDLTNLATIAGFTTTLVVVDLIWGATLTATVAGTTTRILARTK